MKKAYLIFLTFFVSLALAATSLAADMKEGMLQTKQNLISADRLIGLDIENTQGEDLGEIEDVILDQRTGRVAYLLLSRDEFWDIGDQNLIIPFSAVQKQEDRLVLNVTKEKLATVPRWEPGTEQVEYERNLHEFFGGAPYWEAPDQLEEPLELKPTKREPPMKDEIEKKTLD